MEVKEESAGLRHMLPASLSSPGLWVISLTLLAAVLRTIFLNARSLCLVEAWSADRASMPLRELAHQVIGRGNINMGLYHFFLHWWIEFAGSSEISLRAPSVIFATATVPLVYAVGRELFDTETGLLAAVLMAVNVSCIEYAQLARSYALIGMMVTLAGLLFLRTIKDPSGRRCVSYTILGVACAYVHLFGYLVFPAHFISLFLFTDDRKPRERLVICLAIIGALSLVPIWLAITRDHGQVNWIAPTNAKTIIRVFAMFASIRWNELHGVAWILFGVYLATFAIAVVRCWRSDRAAIVFLLSLTLLPVAIAIIVSFFKHLFVPRYMLVCLPFFVLLAALGLKQIRPRAMMASVAMLMVVLSLWKDRKFYYGGPRQDWRGAVALAASELKPGDVLIVFPDGNDLPAKYYLDRLEPRPDFPVVAARIEQLHKAANYADARMGLRQFLRAQSVDPSARIWILTDAEHATDPSMKSLFVGHEITGSHRLNRVELFLIQ